MEQTLVTLMAVYYFYIVGLLLFMSTSRKRAIKNKEVRFTHFKAYTGESTERLEVIKNHYNNQFQIPMLFFIVCLLSIQLDKVGKATIVLALCFIVSRVFHSLLHLGSNDVMKRAYTYFTGVLIIGAMFLANLF